MPIDLCLQMNELASLLEQRLVEMREGMETLITREQQTRADLKSTRNELAMSRIHTKEVTPLPFLHTHLCSLDTSLYNRTC